MMYFLTVVLIGTTYPIFLEVLTSEKISVGPPFYNKLIIPFLIPFLKGLLRDSYPFLTPCLRDSYPLLKGIPFHHEA